MLVLSILVLSMPRLCYSRSGHSYPDSKGACHIARTYRFHPHTTSSLVQDLHPRGLACPPPGAERKSCEDRRSLPSMDVGWRAWTLPVLGAQQGVPHIGKLRFGTTSDEGKNWSSWFQVFSSSLESQWLCGRVHRLCGTWCC